MRLPSLDKTQEQFSAIRASTDFVPIGAVEDIFRCSWFILCRCAFLKNDYFLCKPAFRKNDFIRAGLPSLTMYTQYFGLKENPFALSPDPRYLYLSQRHQDALAHLMYGITGGGGFVQLTGEVGTGKTLMIRAMLLRLPDTVDVALVLYPFLSVRDFMVALCDDLRIKRPAENSLKTLIDTLNTFLLENHAKGRRTVLVVDEAHRLNREVLEQIRLLTNLETTKEKLLQIILVGQPELNSLLARPDMRQLAQRVTARYNLQALLPAETRAYVRHRCQVAGAETPLFKPFALYWVHWLTGGVPRLVNLLCDRSLLAAYARSKTRVGVGIVRAAAREVESGVRVRSRRWVAAPLLILALGAGALGVWQLRPELVAHLVGTRLGNAEAEAPEVSSAKVDKPAAASPNPTQPVLPGSATPTLAQILADPNIPTDTDSAFSALFTLWGFDYAQLTGTTGCERAAQVGLRCLYESGTWSNLRQLNRPAIVELVDDAGLRHHLLVERLTSESVTLLLAGRHYELPLGDVERIWFGKYLALWSPPEIGERMLRRGMRGASVAWVRDTLARYGLPRSIAPASDVFDAELESQVREFQRRHQLQDDGLVGKMTLVYLSNYSGHATAPVLSGSTQAETR
jgi:general secretion pathway protein A